MTGPSRGRRPLTAGAVPAPDVPVFVISVAAELTGLHPQTLRTYDRLGLVTPGRTGGGGRRYSMHDLDSLRAVARLSADGLGLEGVRRVLELEAQVLALRERVSTLESDLTAAHVALAEALAGSPNLPVPMTRQSGQLVLWRRG